MQLRNPGPGAALVCPAHRTRALCLPKLPSPTRTQRSTTAPAAADTADTASRGEREEEESGGGVQRGRHTEREYSRAREREPIPEQGRDPKGVWRAGCDLVQQGSLDCNSAHLLYKDSGKPLFFLLFTGAHAARIYDRVLLDADWLSL